MMGPFTVTAVDFTSALYIRTPKEENKAYICLFTCANTRAIHLEVSDLNEPEPLTPLHLFMEER